MKIFEKIAPVVKVTPLLLFLTMVIPQLVLILFRAGSLCFMGEAVKDSTPLVYVHYLAVPAVLALVALWMIVRRRRSGVDIQQFYMLGALLLQSAALIWFFMQLDEIIPTRVMGADSWVVPDGPFIMVQLATAMPGLFYCFICGANIKFFEKWWVNIIGSFGLLIFIPASVYTVGLVTSSWLPSALISIPIFVGGTLIAAFGFMQLLLWLFKGIRYNWVLMLFCSLILPLGGLALNRSIPFPADLQHWGIYLLTVINAVVLLGGYHSKIREQPLYGICVALCYPFSFYFFFLFLPFLPFSLLAMVVAGAGFLILTPTVLFVMHTLQLTRTFKLMTVRFNKVVAITSFLLAFTLIPAVYVGRAYVHKSIFIKTLDAVYVQSFEDPLKLPSPDTARYVLRKMHDSKEGFYVPILSEVYNTIVFGGMILPDSKMKQLNKLLLGKKYERKNDIWEMNSFYSMFTNESRRRSGRGVRAPSRNVALTEAKVSDLMSSNGVVEASLLITMKSGKAWQAEFRTDIEVPQGVFVSGYELKIEGEMVPARLSDRRAAMWVYHMIRDRERLDPGLVVYTAPDKLKLSVFPFSADQERQCLLKFLYPQGARPVVKIGEKSVQLSNEEGGIVKIETPAGNRAVYIPAGYVSESSAVKRARKKIILSGSDLTPGYCPEWDVKRELLKYWGSAGKQIESVPFFVTQTEQETLEFDRAAWWLAKVPDALWSNNNGGAVSNAIPVIPIKCGEQVAAVSAAGGGFAYFSSQASLERFDGASDTLVPLKADLVISSDSRYSKAVGLWQDWWQTQLDMGLEQSMRQQLLLDARGLNILIPSTAFLAVESMAQAKALKAAEKKSLKKHSTLAFDEFEEENIMDSPEPALWLLMLLALPAAIWWRRREGIAEFAPAASAEFAPAASAEL